MKYLLIFCSFLSFAPIGAEEQVVEKQPYEIYLEGLERLQKEYRQSQADLIADADKVVISIYDREWLSRRDPFGEKETPPSKGYPTPKTLTDAERKAFLPILTKQIRSPDNGMKALCHSPIHYIEIFSKDELIFRSTFCWKCHNFTFEYPGDSQFLATNEDLKEVFNSLMPVPPKLIGEPGE